MANKIHVLLVEHESDDLDKTMNMLQYFLYEVTSVKLASKALSILSKENVQFDLVMVNMNTPDSCGFQLLQVAIKMDLLVILMSNDDGALTRMRALEQGAFLCIKKPVTMQTLEHLWQLVLREKLCHIKENGPLAKVIEYNPQAKECVEEDPVEDNKNNNNNAEEKHKSMKKVNLGTSKRDNVVFKRKVWTKWTVELHGKFMDAIRQLGEGRCYPKDILELMNVPGLTRIQVASHLQKCRNGKWLPPDKRKLRQAKAETTPRENKPPRLKTVRFGSMPSVNDNFQFQEYHEMNYQEFTIDPPTETTVFGHNRVESSNNRYHPQHLLDHGITINPFAENNRTFITGQLGQTVGMNEPSEYGGQSVTPYITNISSNYITEDAFELPIMDSLMTGENFYNFQQDLGMDYNGFVDRSELLRFSNFQSLIDQEDVRSDTYCDQSNQSVDS